MQQWQVNIQKRREKREGQRDLDKQKRDWNKQLQLGLTLNNELELERLRARNMQNMWGHDQLATAVLHQVNTWPSNINNI